MDCKVKIVEGKYRDIDVKDMTFELLKPFKFKAGDFGFVTVLGTKELEAEGRTCRITVHKDKYEILGEIAPFIAPEGIAVVPNETDEDIENRIKKTFAMIENMTIAACKSQIRGLVITGSTGIGKSHGVEQTLRSIFDQQEALVEGVGKRHAQYRITKGSATPIGLYQTLYNYRHEGQVLVFDDCDIILEDDVSLNLLKAALDTNKVRHISWLAESRALKENDVPDSFDYAGSIIFLTNVKFDNYRGRVRDHLKAIVSRCHYLDLELDTTREKIVRIKQIVKEGMLKDYGLFSHQEDEIVDFIVQNQKYFRDVSLRTVTKVADFYKNNPENWKEYSLQTTVSKQSRIIKMLDEKNSAPSGA